MPKSETQSTIPNMALIGQGIQYAVKDGVLLLAIAIDADTVGKASPSSSGKTKLVANTSGHTMVPGLGGLKLNLTLTAPNT